MTALLEMPDRQERLAAANELLSVIASCGRRFFGRGDHVAHLEQDARGRIWFVDAYMGRRIYTHYRWEWRGFTGGGTLRCLVIHLRDFVRAGKTLSPRTFGPWPGGDPWGYGDDMDVVRAAARRLGVVDTREAPDA